MRVLVATDFSPHADDALRIVKGLALPAGSVVRLVHVVEPLPQIYAFAPAAIATLGDSAERQARAALDEAAAKLHAPGREVDTAIVLGRSADVIVEEAERWKADLLVLGSRGRRALASALLGSVSAEVVDRAPCPVLVARGSALRRVILAEDGSPTAIAGASLLTMLPAFRGLEVRVVSVVDAPFPSTISGSDVAMATYSAIQAYYDSLPALRGATGRLAHDRADALIAAGIQSDFEVREGDAAAQLIESAIAHHADCIVIGSHGRTGLARMFLGSVARAVLLNAPCSVLIVCGLSVERVERGKVLARSN